MGNHSSSANDIMRIVWVVVVLTSCASPVVIAYGDYDDSGDDFWRGTPVKNRPKEKIDKNGQRLIATRIRFLKARLKPDRRRTQESTIKLAARLNEIFFEEGLSHNKASPGGPHVIVIQTRDEWDELAEAVFSLPEVYDVMVLDEMKTRPGQTTPYIELWRAEMGDDVPEPLDTKSLSSQSSHTAGKEPKAKKKSGKKKRTSKNGKGQEGSAPSASDL